jgi:hypothetical protein
LDCGGDVVLKDSEAVCTKCGRVWSSDLQAEEGIPMEEESVGKGHAEANYQPGSRLAYGGGLGAGLDGRGLFRILAQGKNGPTDLPLRAAQIRCITQRLDHPTVENLLAHGSKLMKDFGMHTNSEENVQFANVLGKQLRKIGSYFLIRGESAGGAKRVAGCLFYLLFVEKHPSEAARVYAELNLDAEWISYSRTLLAVLTAPKTAKKPKRKQTEN